MVDYIHIMYLGRVVESGPTLEIFEIPSTRTRGLLNSIPKLRETYWRVSSIPGSPERLFVARGCVFRAGK